MADTTRKKTASFDQTTVLKDQNKEKVVETAKNPKIVRSVSVISSQYILAPSPVKEWKTNLKNPKPPLPPRPPGLSKVQPGKRNITPPKLSQHHKEKTSNANQDGHCSRPRRPPPPSTQTSKTLSDCEEGNNKEVDNKTAEIVKAGTSENSLSTGNVSASQDITEHEIVLPNIPQVEASSVSEQSVQESVPASTDTKHSKNICDVKSTQDKTEPNISQAKTEPNISQAKAEPNNSQVKTEPNNSQVKTEPNNPQANTEPNNSQAKTEPNIPVALKPSRPKQPKTSIEHNPESKIDSFEKNQNPSVGVSGMLNTDKDTTKSEQSSTTHKIISKTPERPKPPVRSPLITTDDKLNTLNNDNKNSTAASKETPDIPKPHKVTPPVPPKPDSPRSAKQCKSSKPLDVVGKQSPPVQARRFKHFAKPKLPEPASEIVREKVAERSRNFDVEISSEDETCSIENASTEVVVSSEIGENCPTPQKNNFDKDVQEFKNHGVVETDLEKETQKKTESSVVGSESLTMKEAKPSRPRLPSRKTEDAIKELTSHNNSKTFPIEPSSPLGESCSSKEVQHENNKVENTTSLKPSRPRLPSRKTEDPIKELTSDNDSKISPIEPSSSLDESCSSKEVQNENNEVENTTSLKPSRPCPPIRKTEDPIKELTSHNSFKTSPIEPSSPLDESCSSKEVQRENNEVENTTSFKPSRPRLPSRKTEDPIKELTSHNDSKISPIEPSSPLDESCSSKEVQHENNKVENTTSLKPSRPRLPSRKTEDPIKELTSDNDSKISPIEPSSSLDESCSSKEVQNENNEVENTTSLKPSRPCPPIRKTEDPIKELTSHNSFKTSPIEPSSPLDESCSSKEVQHENNKVENTTSLKPSRPCPPIRKTEDEKVLKSREDSTLLENIPPTPCESVQSHQIVAQEMQHDHSKAGKVASPKPFRPRAPSRKIKDDKVIHNDLTLQEDLSNCPEDQGACKPVTNEVEHKNNNTEMTTPSKPSRPSKPTRPPPLSAATKDSENSFSLDEHESKLSKHQNDKPQRPLNPTLRTESMVVSDSTTDDEAQKNKPQRPSRPKPSSDADESEQDIQKKNPELEDTDAHKEKTPTNKHDVEVDSHHSVKKTGSVKPCRPPEPSGSKHEISSTETSSSCGHTVAGKSKPPRPEAPRHEKRITHDKEESVETSVKPCEPIEEKGTKKTPLKPKRTSISERNAVETQQSETDRDSEITKVKQTLVHNTEENKENLRKAIDSERGETKSNEVMENDNERKVEVKNILVANVKPKETNNISGEETSEQLTSFDLVQPPSPNSDFENDENISCIAGKQREKQDAEETSEDKKSSDRHNVRFRVSSLSKTEVESFNKKEFLEKLKAKGYTGRSSEDNSAPVDRPKPARPRPPSISKKTPDKDEHEDKVEVHENDPLQATGHKKQASASESENISEKSSNISVKPVNMVNQSESNDVSRINKVDNIPEPVASKADKAQNSESAGITGIVMKKCNDAVPEEAIKKKVKRKAPPAPDEKQQDLDDKKMSEKQTRNHQKSFTKPNITTGEQIENTADDLDKHRKSETVRDTEDSTLCSKHTQQLAEEERNNKAVEQPALGTRDNTGGCAEEGIKDLNDVCSALESQEISKNDSLNNDVRKDENVVKAEAIDAVQSPTKKKTPPPKPKRTSSLKRDSKLIVPKRKANEEETAATTELDRNSSPGALNEIIEENSAGKSSTTALHENTSQLKNPSNLASRSKSLAFPGKGRTKESTGKDSQLPGGEEIFSRSFSFSGKNKYKQQPTRPSPPTFFVSDLTTDESTNSEKVSEEASNDDVFIVKDTSSSQEDLVELEIPLNDTKHDSVLTTDSESESEKEPQKSKTYYISREILTTERTFVDVIKLVSEDFREAVAKGSKKCGRALIPDETLHDIMMNISQIYDLDSAFLKALEDRMETWEKEQRIGDIIKTFSPFLKMYKTYIQGYDNAMAILTESLKKYPQFAEVVREFECSERCRNLTVGMYMLKPIQRIPSYRLLLMDYLKHLSKDSLDHKDVSDALAIVSEVATHINEDMKRVDNFEEVLKVQRSLVGQVEIVKPGRELIKEGALMKLSRKEMQPRMFYLFTDILLYTTPVANNQFRLNLTLPLEEIEVELPVSPDFENEFSIIGTKKSFTLSASTLEERDEWLEALRNASDEIRKKKITFHLAKKEKMEALYDAQQREDDKEAQLGSKAPVWIPDARVTMCMLCTDDFTVTNRRHHCRACGKVICGSCSSNSAPLAYLNSETARVCDVCYDELTNKTASTQTVVKPNADAESSAERGETPPKISAAKKSRRHTRLFKSKEVPAVQESTISGYLKTRVGKKWQKRWYVVKDHVLYASKASSDPAAQETTPLLGYEIRGPEKMDGDSKKIVFQLIHAGTEPVVLQTDNMKHGEQWVNALRRATILP